MENFRRLSEFEVFENISEPSSVNGEIDWKTILIFSGVNIALFVAIAIYVNRTNKLHFNSLANHFKIVSPQAGTETNDIAKPNNL